MQQPLSISQIRGYPQRIPKLELTWLLPFEQWRLDLIGITEKYSLGVEMMMTLPSDELISCALALGIDFSLPVKTIFLPLSDRPAATGRLSYSRRLVVAEGLADFSADETLI